MENNNKELMNFYLGSHMYGNLGIAMEGSQLKELFCYREEIRALIALTLVPISHQISISNLVFFSKFLNKASNRILRDTPFVRNWTFHLCHLNEIPGSKSHFWRTIPGIHLKGTINNSPRGFY